MQTVRSFCRNHWGNVCRALPQYLQVGRACGRLVFLLWLVVTGGVRHKPAERVFLFPHYVMTIPDQSVPGEFTRWERGCVVPCHLSGHRNTTNYFQPWNESFPGGSASKESACNAGDAGLVSGSGRSPGGGHGYSLQHSCLENPMDGGGWWATVHGVAKSQTWLSDWQQWKERQINMFYWNSCYLV